MKNTLKLLWALPLFAIISLTSCDKNDPEIPNEEELITTLIYTLTPEGGGNAVEFRFTDLDGDGGDAPVITNGTLAANTTYSGVITLLNETETPAEVISEEVEEEAEEHQFFYQFSNQSFSGGFDYADADGNGNPVGLLTTFATGTPLTTMLTITLRHEPNKTASGVSDGDITNAGGETDIEVTFDVTIQ
ncbi:MAG: type 1 periplasmic binding fold superfamily protein [Flavobacteriales bacterium]|nr:type 1 periplasmic binding fold superfamily protein [Flavobacteriales bacterium]